MGHQKDYDELDDFICDIQSDDLIPYFLDVDDDEFDDFDFLMDFAIDDDTF